MTDRLSHARHAAASRLREAGFTLIELLVVIAIIAVVMSLLLPALAGAREAGRDTVCKANQKSMITALTAYEATYRGFIPGPNTSGYALQQNKAYTLGSGTPAADDDWVSPLLGDSMNFPTERLPKIEAICMTKFRCPNNTVRYGVNYTTGSGRLPMESRGELPFTLSYMSPAYFMLAPFGTPGAEVVPQNEPIIPPKGYAPKITNIGFDASKKIMSFEGARYWLASHNTFDFSTATNNTGLAGSPQSNFLSRGVAFQASGENYARGNRYEVTDTLRSISLRHSERMNAAFFDGHVGSMSDRDSLNPSYYVPSGSRANPNAMFAFWLRYVDPTSPLVRNNTKFP